MFLRGGAGLIVAFSLVFLLVVPMPQATAQAAACNDFNDGTGDLDRDPANVNQADSVTGLHRADLSTGCVRETATTIEVLINIGAAGPAGTQQRTEFTLTFKNATATFTETFADVAGTESRTPAGRTHDYSGQAVLFIVPKAAIGAAAGAVLGDFVVTSFGEFVDPANNVVTSADRAPDTGSVFPLATGPYRVGSRAPPTLDSDGDGVPDRTEITLGTDPTSADSDSDGLLDGASRTEASGSANATNFSAMQIYVLSDDGATITFAGEDEYGTNATDPDTDGDGLLDGPNIRAPIGGEASATFSADGLTPISSDGTEELYLGEVEYGADPTNPDTDADGLLDREEITGSENSAYASHSFFAEFPGSTDPANDDSDGDNLTDAEELAGEVTRGGTARNFSALNPNERDTDLDQLSDFDEVFGRADIEGREVIFDPTDPTNPDSDGDGTTDYDELRGNTDPRDRNDKPGQDDQPGGAEASYLVLSTIAMLVVILLCVIGIMVRWG